MFKSLYIRRAVGIAACLVITVTSIIVFKSNPKNQNTAFDYSSQYTEPPTANHSIITDNNLYEENTGTSNIIDSQQKFNNYYYNQNNSDIKSEYGSTIKPKTSHTTSGNPTDINRQNQLNNTPMNPADKNNPNIIPADQNGNIDDNQIDNDSS